MTPAPTTKRRRRITASRRLRVLGSDRTAVSRTTGVPASATSLERIVASGWIDWTRRRDGLGQGISRSSNCSCCGSGAIAMCVS